jgi:hypothetical protein
VSVCVVVVVVFLGAVQVLLEVITGTGLIYHLDKSISR